MGLGQQSAGKNVRAGAETDEEPLAEDCFHYSALMEIDALITRESGSATPTGLWASVHRLLHLWQ
jgi:hypothetical protein